ncbi:hypothetical protein KEM54_004564, partial [Ascosphaera aggregata]
MFNFDAAKAMSNVAAPSAPSSSTLDTYTPQSTPFSGPMTDFTRFPLKPNKVPPPAQNVQGTKFNVRATEFRPNPAASTFTPGNTSPALPVPATVSGPATAARPPAPKTPTAASFWGNKKPISPSQRPSIKNHFNSLERIKTEAAANAGKDPAARGGFPPAYRTPPTWETAPANEDKTYKDMFKGVANAGPRTSTQGQHLPHQHHASYHMRPHTPIIPPNMPATVPAHLSAAPHHPGVGPFEDHHSRMQQMPPAGGIYQSPRLQHDMKLPLDLLTL